jgi:galactokinase/mevalonate kinase-like predicted kinase
MRRKPIRRTRTTLGSLLHRIFPDGFRSSRTTEDKAAQGEGAEYNASLVDEAETIPGARRPSVCEFGRLLHERWQIRRTLTEKITNRDIDEINELGRLLAPWAGNRFGHAAAAFLWCSWYRESGIGRSRLG